MSVVQVPVVQEHLEYQMLVAKASDFSYNQALDLLQVLIQAMSA
jgi:hypothetical protein